MKIKQNKTWKGKYEIRHEKEKGSSARGIAQRKMEYYIEMELQTNVKWRWQTVNGTNSWMFRELECMQRENGWNVVEFRRLCLRDSLYTEFYNRLGVSGMWCSGLWRRVLRWNRKRRFITRHCHISRDCNSESCTWYNCVCVQYTRVGTLIVATIYLQLIQNRYMFRSFTVLHCSH